MSAHYCRECGGELDVIHQSGYAPAGTPDRTYVTCWNEPDCPLGGQTLDIAGYAERDLTAYIRSWEAKTGRVWEADNGLKPAALPAVTA